MRKITMHIISAVSMICLWQIFSKLVNSPLILPSFFRVLADFFSLLKTKIFYAALLSTFRRVMESFCMSLFLGSVLGFFYGRFEAVKNLRKVIVHFVVFPAGQKHISYMNCGKHKQEAYDEVRIVSDRFRILFRKIEEEETEEVHESADKNI